MPAEASPTAGSRRPTAKPFVAHAAVRWLAHRVLIPTVDGRRSRWFARRQRAFSVASGGGTSDPVTPVRGVTGSEVDEAQVQKGHSIEKNILRNRSHPRCRGLDQRVVARLRGLVRPLATSSAAHCLISTRNQSMQRPRPRLTTGRGMSA